MYADITNDEWAVAIAYNQVLNPGLWGTENSLESKYAFPPDAEPVVKRLETEIGEGKPSLQKNLLIRTTLSSGR